MTGLRKNLFIGFVVGLLCFIVVSLCEASTVPLQWDENKDADYYVVYWRTAGETDWTAILPASEKLTIETLSVEVPEGQTKEFSVKAVNRCGNTSDFSDIVSYTSHTPGVITPTKTNHIVKWESYVFQEGIQGFELVCTNSEDSQSIKLPDPALTTLDFCDLEMIKNDVVYTCKIAAIGLYGDIGPYSEGITYIRHTPVKIKNFRF